MGACSVVCGRKYSKTSNRVHQRLRSSGSEKPSDAQPWLTACSMLGKACKNIPGCGPGRAVQSESVSARVTAEKGHSPDERLCDVRLLVGDCRCVLSCETLFVCEPRLESYLFLFCLRRGSVRCLSELMNDFDFCGLSPPGPLPSRGVDGEYGLPGECPPSDRGSVDA